MERRDDADASLNPPVTPGGQAVLGGSWARCGEVEAGTPSGGVRSKNPTGFRINPRGAAGMALACLPCARHLWRSPTAAVWGVTAAVDAAMLGLHAQMLASTSAHAHSGASVGALMWLGVLLVGGTLLTTAVALLRIRRATGPAH